MDGYVTCGEGAAAPAAGGEDASQEQADVEERTIVCTHQRLERICLLFIKDVLRVCVPSACSTYTPVVE